MEQQTIEQLPEVGILEQGNYHLIQYGQDNNITADHLQKNPLEIIQVCSYNNNLGFIDSQRNLWIVNDNDKKTTNLSNLIGKKVDEVWISQDQMIIKCEKKDYLLYLKTSLQQPPVYALHKITSFKPRSILEKYTIYQLQEQYDKYYLSYSQKHQKGLLNFAYRSKRLKNLDSGHEYTFEGEMVGLSFSKYHSMSWDNMGNVYSWGLRSSWIVETTELILEPKKVNSLTEQFVFSGLADEYYSIVLNCNGELIEWGIKNKIQIYPHRRIRGKYILERIIALKGNQKTYACMGVSGKIYIWGNGVETFGIQGNKDFPTICHKLTHKKISDFDISKNYIVIIVSQVSQLLRRFKALQQNGIKTDLKKLLKSHHNTKSKIAFNYVKPVKPRLKTQTSEQFIENCQQGTYFINMSEEQEVVNYINSKPKKINRKYTPSVTYYSRSIEHNMSFMFDLKQRRDILINKINTKISGIQTSARSTRSQINQMIKDNPLKIKQYRTLAGRQNKVQHLVQSPRKTSPYNFRLKQVTDRKMLLETVRLSTLTQNTFQSRRIKKQLVLREKRNELLKTVVSALMKDWICQVLSKPIIGAKLIMVQQFRNSLAFEMKVKRLQSVFFQKYIRQRIQALSSYSQYLIMRFVKRTKQKLRIRREKKLAKDIMTQSTIFNVKKKVSHMILLFTFTIKKYQKICKWLKQVKAKKLLALRIKWNLHVINSNIIQFKQQQLYLQFKNQESDELTVYDIYQNFLRQQPQLKLAIFVDKHPIFRINFDITKKIDVRVVPTPKREHLKNTRKQSIVAKLMKKSKVLKIFLGKKLESKDNQFEKLKIMPYSQDYNQLIFSRKYSLKVPESVLNMSRWAQFQSNLIQKLLEHLIMLNRKNFKKDLYNYKIQMANFIQTNIENIQNRRAPYLLIPLQIPSSICTKMKQQLDEIIIKAEKKYLMKEHLMQDRHVILDIALKLQNCPVKPILTDNITRSVFKQFFLIYVTKLSKASRLFNIKNTAKISQILKFD